MSSGYDPLASVGRSTKGADTLQIRMARPTTGAEELAAITEVLESGILTNGPWTRRFEADTAARHGTKHGVAMANGTVALAAMYLASGIGPGDEVIVPSITFIATASAVVHVGATPVFADVEADTLNLDVDAAAAAITSRTKAIVPVHYAGQPADMQRFKELANTHGLVLLEDAAQAHGAVGQGRPAGSWGDSAMFSFTPTKNITTGEGAVVTTNSDELAHKLRLLRNHGMSAPYQHEMLGYNWRLSEMQSAMGVVQLQRLDTILSRKTKIVDALRSGLASIPGITVLVQRPDRTSSNMIFTVRVANGQRDELARSLANDGIETRIYFPPIHSQLPFSHLAVDPLPVTEAVAPELLSLPCHHRLDETDIQRIVATVRSTMLKDA